MSPLFSIVIPTFNRANLIGNAVNSILKNGVNMQIIVVDDGSTDNTAEIIRAFTDVRVSYFRIENSERGAARNFGLKKAVGRYVNYFDSDDVYLPCLERLSKFIVENGDPDVIYGLVKQVNEYGREIAYQKQPYTSFGRNLLHNNFLACGSVFIKREIALQCLFHEDRRLSSAEDWELWLRIHTQYSFTHFPSPIFQQVHHGSRSLALISPDRIEERDNYFASLVVQDERMRKHYGDRAINLFIADRYTFISLAWCRVNRVKSFLYWKKSFFTTAQVLVRKRFWAILKNLAFQ